MDTELQRAEFEFNKLAKLAKQIKIPDGEHQFMDYTEKEIADAAEAAAIIKRIEDNHCKLDIL